MHTRILLVIFVIGIRTGDQGPTSLLATLHVGMQFSPNKSAPSISQLALPDP